MHRLYSNRHNLLRGIQVSDSILKLEAESDGLFLEMFKFGKSCFKLSPHVATFIKKYDREIYNKLVNREPDTNNTIWINISTSDSLKGHEIEKLKEYKAVLINGVVTGKIKIV